jgi:hypothetical protein
LHEENVELRSRLAAIEKRHEVVVKNYEAVRVLKDLQEVEEVERHNFDPSVLEKFNAANEGVKKAMVPFSKVVTAIILCDYLGRSYEPDTSGFFSYLQAAERQKIISHVEHGKFTANYDDKDVIRLVGAIESLRDLIRSSCSTEEFYKAYEAAGHEADLDLENEKYWREHFDFRVPT